MSTATAGRAREHKTREDMGKTGWLQVARSAGSKGAADLVMVHPDHGLALVQVGTQSKSLGPTDRARLLTLADLCSALPLIAIHTPRQPIRYRLVIDGPPSTWTDYTP